MLAVGSRGDVQPLAVLAGALGRRGVPVRVVALAEYAGIVAEESPGASFVPVAAGLGDALQRGGFGEFLTRTPVGQLELLRRWTAGMASEVADAALTAARPGDTVLAGVLARGVAAALASGRGCRAATVVYTGQVPTLHADSFFFAPWFTGWRPYDTWGARTSWRLATAAGAELTRAARGRLGLPRLGISVVSADADRHPTILAASPVLVPPAPDWPSGVHQTGYLAPPGRPFTPDAALAAFLGEGAGERPVYVGFGSLTHFTTGREFELVVRAAAASGRRVVTPAPPGVAPGPVSAGVFAIGPVPHRWLFARMAATVHHGGSGTTHEALLAGVPSAVIPFGVDQPYHARRLHALGVGPEPLPLRRLTAQRLGRLIGALAGPGASGYRGRAAAMAAEIRAEDGVGRTVALLERLGLLEPMTP
jgi:UDP:flavonoid glycosyltransferase YjiC (YdhE family)